MRNYTRTIRAAVERFGSEKQLIVAIEEMSELTKEITKSLRGEHSDDAIAEEMADVYIMLAQMRHMFYNHYAVDKWVAHKFERLRNMLELEPNEQDDDDTNLPGYERGFNDGFDKGRLVMLEAVREVIKDRIEELEKIEKNTKDESVEPDACGAKWTLLTILGELDRESGKTNGEDDNG